MTAPRPREQRRPPSPPDRRPPRRGGGSSPSPYAASAAGRPAGPARLCGARRGLVRSVRALAAAALLALSGALALPAQAQTTCTVTPGDLWCGVLTIGTTNLGGITAHGYVGFNNTGSLLPSSFTHEGTTITIVKVVHNVSSLVDPDLEFVTSPALPSGYNFVLQVGSQSFDFAGDNTSHIFANPGVDWSMSDGETVTLRLREVSSPPVRPQTTNFYLWRTTVTVGSAAGKLGYDKSDSLGSISTSAKFGYAPWNPPHKHHVDRDSYQTVAAIYSYVRSGTDYLRIDTPDITRIQGSPGSVTLWLNHTAYPFSVGTPSSGDEALVFNTAFDDTPEVTWKEGDTVRVALVYERRLPSAPQNVSVTAPQGEGGTLEVSWDAADAGTFPIECYLVEFVHPRDAKKRKHSYPGSRGPGKGCGDTPPTSVKRTDLEEDVRYEVQVQALSGDGFSEWSDAKTAPRTNRGRALGARFVSPPERHDGTKRIKVRVEFSEAPENVGADGVEVEGGAVTSVSPVGGNAPGGAGN